MSDINNFSADDESAINSASVTLLQNQLSELLKQLSPERLQVLADFAAYLASAEGEAATQELLAIPGLLERVKQNQATPEVQHINWRSLRSDVGSSAPSGCPEDLRCC